MNSSEYFYRFLEPISKELAFLAGELEHTIFTSPRTMLLIQGYLLRIFYSK